MIRSLAGCLVAATFVFSCSAEVEPPREAAELGEARQGLAPGPIDVHFHVIAKGYTADTGYVSDWTIQNQIQVLNGAFAPGGWWFNLVSIDRTINANWFAMAEGSGDEHDAKLSLHRGTKAALNIYSCEPMGGVLEWGSFPWENAGTPEQDGIVIHYGSMPGGSAAPYDLGKSAVQATGHWMGLFHVFTNGCSAPGDYVSDTPPQATPSYGCPHFKDSCRGQAGRDSIHNFMDYVDDACMWEFTPGQFDRMEKMVKTNRY